MILDELRMILGDELLRRFLGVYARTDVRFGKNENSPSFDQLVRVIGQQAAAKLRRHFAGERIYVPCGIEDERERRKAEICGRIAAGDSSVSIARSYRITERHVRRIAAGMKERELAE